MSVSLSDVTTEAHTPDYWKFATSVGSHTAIVDVPQRTNGMETATVTGMADTGAIVTLIHGKVFNQRQGENMALKESKVIIRNLNDERVRELFNGIVECGNREVSTEMYLVPVFD